MICERCCEEICHEDTIRHLSGRCGENVEDTKLEDTKLGDRLIDSHDCAAVAKAHAECCENKPFYTVKPFNWQMGRHGRSGTSYQVVENRALATTKSECDANIIVKALNDKRASDRKISSLSEMLRFERAKASQYISLSTVDAVITAEARKSPRWSTSRENLEYLRKTVIDRLREIMS